MAAKRLVNLGCGSRCHPDWINIDYVPANPMVMRHDLRRGIPLPDESADVLYHSHVLEHFEKNAGREFLRECFRVLKKNGIVRVAVPNLEQIARLYLNALEQSLQGSQSWQLNYEWLMLELYDQTVRERSGGALADYCRRDPIPNREFVLERIGIEGKRLMDSSNGSSTASNHNRKFWSRAVSTLKQPSQLGPKLRNVALRVLLGEENYKSFRVGKFRQGGEIHQWMYDRYSLARVLEGVGFVRTQQCKPTESAIVGWQDFHLDTEPDGTVYKPDSMYMEAVKA